MSRKLLIFISWLFLLQLSLQCQAEQLKVVFLNPGHPMQNTTGRFWSNVTEFMNAAAEDLDLELVTIYSYRNHILMRSLFEQIVAQQPEYVVLVNEKNTILPLFKQLAAAKIPVFMLLNSFSDNELTQMTNKERSLYLGSIVPNNYQVGKALINDLIKLHKNKHPEVGEHKITNILALQGDLTTPASLERERGFFDYLKLNPHVQLIDNPVAQWSKRTAYLKVRGLLRRKQIDVIWAANDAMAFGAKQAVEEVKPDYPVIIGGINWDTDDKQYPVDISYGGHVVMGAFALVMLKDIYNQETTLSENFQQLDIFKSSNSDFAESFKQRLASRQFSGYDFSLFRKVNDQSLTFSIASLHASFTEIESNN